MNAQPKPTQRRNPWILAALWLSAASPVFGQGQVVGWGENGGGQLAPPVGSMLGFRSLAVGSSHVLAVLQDGSVSGWGGNVFGQSSPPGLAFVTSVAAGGAHSLALLSEGSAACAFVDAVAAVGDVHLGERVAQAGALALVP